jgi:hypothetical protein
MVADAHGGSPELTLQAVMATDGWTIWMGIWLVPLVAVEAIPTAARDLLEAHLPLEFSDPAHFNSRKRAGFPRPSDGY